MKAIKCAIIGLGRIGSILEEDELREKPASHAGAIDHNPETLLVAGCDNDPEQRTLFAQRWDLSSVYSDAAHMLNEHRPDILHIATHADSHMHYLELAVKEQVPVVICEKPVSDFLAKALRMKRILNKPGCRTRVLVNHERRYSKDYLRVKNMVEDKTYGRLISLDGKVFMGKTREIRDILLHDGTHMLDLIPFLTGGPLKQIKAFKSGDHNLMIMGCSALAGVFCQIGNARDHLVFEMELSFERGRIRIGNGIYEKYSSEESPYYENFRSLKKQEKSEVESKTDYFSGMLEDAVLMVKDHSREAVSSFENGLESLRIIRKVQRILRRL